LHQVGDQTKVTPKCLGVRTPPAGRLLVVPAKVNY